jgi:hypothetical protein
MIDASRHGKDEVDGINSTAKNVLKEKTKLTDEADEADRADNQQLSATWFNAAAAVMDGRSVSLAEICMQFCSDPCQFEGVKSDKKYKKREAARSMQRHFYHLEKPDDLLFNEGKWEAVFPKSPPNTKHDGINSHHHLLCRPKSWHWTGGCSQGPLLVAVGLACCRCTSHGCQGNQQKTKSNSRPAQIVSFI